MMTWFPNDHTDEENLQWSMLRAMEWGQWPIFLAQPVGPVLLLWLSWKVVVPSIVALNILWAVFIRYRFVSVRAAFIGPLFVLCKWATWPAATAYLFLRHAGPERWVAVFWPLLIYALMFLPPSIAVGRIQAMFMRALGYKGVGLESTVGHA
jgi:hypothetical protein